MPYLSDLILALQTKGTSIAVTLAVLTAICAYLNARLASAATSFVLSRFFGYESNRRQLFWFFFAMAAIAIYFYAGSVASEYVGRNDLRAGNEIRNTK